MRISLREILRRVGLVVLCGTLLISITTPFVYKLATSSTTALFIMCCVGALIIIGLLLLFKETIYLAVKEKRQQYIAAEAFDTHDEKLLFIREAVPEATQTEPAKSGLASISRELQFFDLHMKSIYRNDVTLRIIAATALSVGILLIADWKFLLIQVVVTAILLTSWLFVADWLPEKLLPPLACTCLAVDLAWPMLHGWQFQPEIMQEMNLTAVEIFTSLWMSSILTLGATLAFILTRRIWRNVFDLVEFNKEVLFGRTLCVAKLAESAVLLDGATALTTDSDRYRMSSSIRKAAWLLHGDMTGATANEDERTHWNAVRIAITELSEEIRRPHQGTQEKVREQLVMITRNLLVGLDGDLPLGQIQEIPMRKKLRTMVNFIRSLVITTIPGLLYFASQTIGWSIPPDYHGPVIIAIVLWTSVSLMLILDPNVERKFSLMRSIVSVSSATKSAARGEPAP